MSSAESPAHAAGSDRTHLAVHALLVLAVLAVFGGVIGFPFLAFDDAELIVRNPLIFGADVSLAERLITPTVGYIVPVTVALERVLFSLSQGAPWSFHLAALLLHALNACLVFALALRLGARASFAFAATSVFALHPLVVQPVAWAICLKDLLMAALVLCALHAFWRALHPPDAEPQSASRRLALAALAALVLAMLSKPTATLVGFALLAAVLVRHRSGAPVPRATRMVALLAAGFGVLLGFVSRIAHDARMGVERVESWTPWFPLSVLGRHAAHALWPGELFILYPEPSGALDAFALLGVLCLLALGAALWLARRSAARVLLIVLGIAAYLPVSNLLPFGRVMSDSYLYVPLAAGAVSLALALHTRAGDAPLRMQRVIAGALMALSIALGITSHTQLQRYRGGPALWAPVVRAYPKLYRAHKLYADELLLRGEPQRAADRFVYAFSFGYDANDLLELGSVLSIVGRVADAECVLIEATLRGTKPGFAAFNYAVLLAYNAQHQSAYPGIAKGILADVERLRASGKLAFPPQVLPGLQARIAQLAQVQAHVPQWPARNCSVLKSAR